MSAADPSVATEVGHLFRTKRVQEIRAIESTIRADAEDRSGNLRTLLGTRYRDLLAASDAVAAAHSTSRDAVHDALSGVARDANVLRADFLHEKTSDRGVRTEERQGVSVVGGRLLCIVDGPEVLYACLESGRVFEGATRFRAAERAFRALEGGVVNAFVKGRWERVEVFRGQILQAARARMGVKGVGVEDVAGCFVTEIVLGGRRADEVLERLLGGRKEWVEGILRRATGVRGGEEGSAKDVCTGLAMVVRDTVVCCQQLFFRESPLVDKMYAGLGEEEYENGSGSGLVELRESGGVVKMVSAWIAGVEERLRELGAHFVESGNSARELSEALDTVQSIFDHEDWAGGCGNLELSTDRGVRMVESAVADRAKVLAELCVRESAESAIKDIDAAVSDVLAGHNAGEELWGNVLSKAVHSSIGSSTMGYALAASGEGGKVEIVQTGATLLIAKKLEGKVGVSMKDAGFLVDRIPDVGTELRSAVGKHFPSLATCLLEKAMLIVEEARVHADKVRKGGSDSVGGVDSITADLLRVDSDAAKSQAKCVERALFVARTATAIACSERVGTAFTYCLGEGTSPLTLSTSAPSSNALAASPELTAFHAKLMDAASRAYEAWAEGHCIVFESQLRCDLESVQVLEVRCAWNKPRKPQSGDADGATASAASEEDSPPCPTAPSSGTLRFVMSGCDAANRGGGLALPPKAVDALTWSMRSLVAEVFRDCVESYNCHRKEAAKTGLKRPENVFLQLLFDLRFLSLVLSDRAAKSKSGPTKAGTPFAAVIDDVTQEIDPINLSSMSKVIDEAVESYFARSGVLLGTLTRSAGKSAIAVRRTMTGTSIFSTANVLAVAPPAPRFSYLPAPMPSTYTARSGLTAGLGANAAMDIMRTETASSELKRDAESSVVDYASQLTKNVGRFGRGFLDSWRSVAQ